MGRWKDPGWMVAAAGENNRSMAGGDFGWIATSSRACLAVLRNFGLWAVVWKIRKTFGDALGFAFAVLFVVSMGSMDGNT